MWLSVLTASVALFCSSNDDVYCFGRNRSHSGRPNLIGSRSSSWLPDIFREQKLLFYCFIPTSTHRLIFSILVTKYVLGLLRFPCNICTYIIVNASKIPGCFKKGHVIILNVTLIFMRLTFFSRTVVALSLWVDYCLVWCQPERQRWIYSLFIAQLVVSRCRQHVFSSMFFHVLFIARNDVIAVNINVISGC